MPPTRRSIPSSAPASSSSRQPRPAAVASTTTLPETCTPGYVPPEAAGKGKGKEVGGRGYTEDERAALMIELLGFEPRTMLETIAEYARTQIADTTGAIESYLNRLVGKNGGGERRMEEEAREVDIGLASLDTLLYDHMDNALDKFVAWALRNAFELPEGTRLTLPWHVGLDFDRGAWVVGQPGGEDAIVTRIQSMKDEIEDMRKIKAQLEAANKKLDQRLKEVGRQKEEVGFVLDLVEEFGLSPLPQTTQKITSSISTLHTKLSSHDLPPPPSSSLPLPPSSSGPAEGVKEWELGRAAYLNWATKRLVHPGGDEGGKGKAGQGELEVMKEEMGAVGGEEGMMKLGMGLEE